MGVTAERIGRKAIKAADVVVNIGILLFILLLMAFSGYALWDSKQLYGSADAAKYEIYKPCTEEEGKSFGELQALNPEVFSWLTVYGTHMDYPVAQGKDNQKYVNTDALGEYSLSGAIFLDSKNSRDYSDFNSILYGHHMEKKAMFGELGAFSKKQFFDSHPYGNLYYGGKDHGLEFFAFLHTDAYDWDTFSPNIQGESEQQAYLEMVLQKAMHTRSIGLTGKEHIVLLTTCSMETTNGRDILAARITDTVYEDTFKTNERDGEPTSVDVRVGFLARIPTWLLITAVTIGAGLVILLIYRKGKKKRKGQ